MQINVSHTPNFFKSNFSLLIALGRLLKLQPVSLNVSANFANPRCPWVLSAVRSLLILPTSEYLLWIKKWQLSSQCGIKLDFKKKLIGWLKKLVKHTSFIWNINPYSALRSYYWFGNSEGELPPCWPWRGECRSSPVSPLHTENRRKVNAPQAAEKKQGK